MPGSPLSIRRSWPGREASALAWSADGERFASAIRSTVTVSDADPVDDDPRIVAPGPVLSLAFCGDRLLAAPYQIGLADAEVLAAATAGPTDATGGDYAVRAGAWSPDGAVAILACRYLPPRGLPARPGGTGPAGRVVCVTGDTTTEIWSGVPVGDVVVTAGADWLAFADTTLRLVGRTDLSTPPIDLVTRDASVRTVAFDLGESRLAAGWADGSVTVCSTTDGAVAASWSVQDADVQAVAWVGDRLLVGSADGTVRLFTAGGEALGGSDPREHQPIVALAVDPGGGLVRASVGGPRAELLEFRLP